MRPLELRLEGFRSYDRPVVFDWRDRQLVGIVGPIGSGKSSILDAISFALYGKTPVFERESKTLIHQAGDHFRVRLDFEVDGEVWRALRVVRTKGASQHALYRMSGPDAGAIPEAEREREVTARIEQLLRLDFAAFNRSVLLAQNRFAQLLHASPGERDKVLKGVFGFDRIDAMHALARARRGKAETAVAGLEGRLEALAGDREKLPELRSLAAQAGEHAERLAAAAKEIDRWSEDEKAAARQLERAVERLTAVGAVNSQIPSQADVHACARRIAVCRAAGDQAEKALATARTTLGSAEKAHRELAGTSGTAADLARAEQALRGLERTRTRAVEEKKSRKAASKAVGKADETHTRAVAEHAAVRAAENEAEAAVDRAAEARAAAEASLRAAELARMAATVRRTIEVGTPCPVCGQAVSAVPTEARDQPLADAERGVEARRQEEAAARRAYREASKQAAAGQQAAADVDAGRARARKRYEETTDRLRRAEQEAAALTVELTDRLGLGDPAEQLARLSARLSEAEKRLERARTAEKAAIGQREQAGATASDARAAATRLTHRLANLAGSLGAELDASLDLESLKTRLDQAVAEAEDAAIRDRDRADADQRKAREQRRKRLAELDLDPDVDFTAVRDLALRQAAEQQAEVARLEQAAATADQVAIELEAARVALRHLRQLSEDLTAPRFLRYLLDEERAALAELGSERFEMLSGGRYRFAEDGSFAVVDLANAESVRKAETLSGGETFLASLALALALAETVTSSGGQLDAFFLDEGFGALDDEHLELAMDGIERLIADSPNRLVCVVSHVPALTERVDDLIVLDKDPLTGASRVVRGGRHEE